MRPSASGLLKRQAARMLVHRYTRAVVDAAGAPGMPIGGQPCLYTVKDVLITDAAGSRTVSTPTLRVLPGDPLGVGDLVSDIRTQPQLGEIEGLLLMAGPLAVETIDEGASTGVAITRVATLRGTDIQRAD